MGANGSSESEAPFNEHFYGLVNVSKHTLFSLIFKIFKYFSYIINSITSI